MNKIMIVGALIALTATGCVSVNKNDGGVNLDMNPVLKDVVHEKLTVQDKPTTARDQMNCLFGFIFWGSTATHVADLTDCGFGMIGKVKNGAYANACDAAKCDLLVGTRYKLTVEDYIVFGRWTAEVTGYPAKVSGVEVIEDKNTDHAIFPPKGFSGKFLPF